MKDSEYTKGGFSDKLGKTYYDGGSEETPPAETPPVETLPQEPVDSRGVPYKNVVAEYERKLNEAIQLNQQYAQVLGAQRQQQAAPVTQATNTEDLDSLLQQYDEPTRKVINALRKQFEIEAERRAERVGYKLMTRVVHENTLSQDREVYEEAQRQYAALKQNPLWGSVDDTLLQDRAISEANNIVLRRKFEAQTKTNGQSQARAGAAVANLPVTQRGAASPPAGDKQKWINEYVAQPETLTMFKMFEGHTYNPESEQDKKKMLETAEEAYRGTKFTGATAKAFQAIKSGMAEHPEGVFGGKVEEV